MCVCVCVCCHPIYSGRQVGGRTSRGHHRISPPSFSGAFFLARRIQRFLSLDDCEAEFWALTNQSSRFTLSSMEMSRLTRDGTAEPVSRDQILRHARGQGNTHFPYSADHEQDWHNLTRLIHTLLYICDDHKHIHIHCWAFFVVVVFFVFVL